MTGLVDVVESYLPATIFNLILMASFERIPYPQLGIISNGNDGGDEGIDIYCSNLNKKLVLIQEQRPPTKSIDYELN